jgi:hypothetical protein
MRATTPATTDEVVTEVRSILDEKPMARKPRLRLDRKTGATVLDPKPKPKLKAAKAATPRASSPKADPARVREYFATLGMSRSEIAAALGKSVALLAHVTRESGDRWSVDRFADAIAKLEKYTKSKKLERPITEPMKPDMLSMFLIPEGESTDD